MEWIEGIDTEFVSEMCHESSLVYFHSIGDYTGHHWENTPNRVRADVRLMVEYVFLSDVLISAADLHVKWVKSRVSGGWSYGPIRSFSYKTDPLLISYDELRDIDKLRYIVFLRIIDSFLRV